MVARGLAMGRPARGGHARGGGGPPGCVPSPPPTSPHADPCNDRAWLRAQWGQLALVALGVGFLIGGITIATVGVTDVFVREDLSYLHTTASALHAANPHFVPLVAHDRAGFGGALVSDGVAFLLAALWGIRRGGPGVRRGSQP